MKRLKIFIGQVVLGALSPLFISTAALAMCCGFFPVDARNFEPADNTKTLIVLQDGRQHTIVQPEFRGFLADFALVMPAPAEPSVTNAPADLFDQLENYTNPVSNFGRFDEGLNFGAELDFATADSGVRVIERKDVGTYSVTTLKATDTTELLEWLSDNGYESDDNREEILDYYVNTNGYFVALKVNSSALRSGQVTLDPIDISFDLEGKPTVPTRLLGAMPRTMSYIVYVLAAEPYVIAGGDVEYSAKVGLSDIIFGDAKPLLGYDGYGQWLVRNKIDVDPDRVTTDTALLRVADSGSSAVESGRAKRNVNKSKYVAGSGIVRPDCSTSSRVYNEPTEDIVGTRTIVRPGGYTYTNTAGLPDDCTFSNGFDLGIGDVKTNSGPPVLVLLRAFMVIFIAFIVWWRYRVVRKHGLRRLIPDPFRGIKNAYRWIDHKTNHKLFVSSKVASPRFVGYRNAAYFGVLTLMLFTLAALHDQYDWRITNILAIGVVALMVALAIVALFIRPTVLQVTKGWQAVKEYFVAVIIGTVGIVTLAWLVFNSLFDL